MIRDFFLVSNMQCIPAHLVLFPISLEITSVLCFSENNVFEVFEIQSF